MDVRNEIRNILKEVFLGEAIPTIHFKDRVHGRLSSTLYTRPAFDYSSVENQIELIKKINFDPSASYAVQIKSFPTTFVSKDPETGVPSIGDELWLVVRDNSITTVFFRNSSQRGTEVKGVDYTLRINQLAKYYEGSKKNPDGTVDFSINKSKSSHKGKGSRKRVELDLPVVDIKGDKWFVDENNEEIIFSKNIKKKISFDDMDESILEKVINAVTI